MGLKKKLGMGVASAALGLSLIAGGTYAYFSDTEVSNNTFAAGTLDLSVEPSVIIDVDNLKPGDTITRDFVLANEGSLDIKDVTLDTAYTVTDAKGDNTEDFGEHIKVEFMYNLDQFNEVIFETTLADLQGMTKEAVTQAVFGSGDVGLPVGDAHDLVVDITFVDNGADQNEFQGDSIELEWTFGASQTPGEAR